MVSSGKRPLGRGPEAEGSAAGGSAGDLGMGAPRALPRALPCALPCSLAQTGCGDLTAPVSAPSVLAG